MPVRVAELKSEGGRLQKFYRPELDGLRWYAAFGVYAYHTLPRSAVFYAAHHFPGWLSVAISSLVSGGCYGVDLFFVLSSYLITELLCRERERTGTVHVRDFYLRRACRIWPLYFFVLGLSLAATLVDHTQNLTGRHVFIFALFCGNWLFVLKPDSIVSIANPLWSVSVEEQFYLAWPWVVKRASLWRVGVAMLIVAWTTRILIVVTGARLGIWNNTLARLDPIALGSLLAVWLNGGMPRLSVRARMLLISLGLLAIGIAGALPGSEFPASAWVLVLYPVAAIGALLLVVGCLGWNIWPLANRFVVYLGGISYGIYLFHRPCLWLVKRVYFNLHTSTKDLAAYWIVSLILTIVAASLSKRFIELPFLRLKQRFAHDGSTSVPASIVSVPVTEPGIVEVGCLGGPTIE